MAKTATKGQRDLPGEVIARDLSPDVVEVRLVNVADLFDIDGNLRFEDPDNARQHNDAEIARLTNSIGEHGMLEAFAVNRMTGQIVGGHGRVQGALRAHVGKLIMLVTEKDYIRQRAANISLNVEGYGHNDTDMLAAQLQELAGTLDPNNGNILEQLEGLTSVEPWTLRDLLDMEADFPDSGDGDDGREHRTLAERFVVPPFSILDARQGYWQERKRYWQEQGVSSDLALEPEATMGGNPPDTDDGLKIDQYRANERRQAAASYKGQDSLDAITEQKRSKRSRAVVPGGVGENGIRGAEDINKYAKARRQNRQGKVYPGGGGGGAWQEHEGDHYEAPDAHKYKPQRDAGGGVAPGGAGANSVYLAGDHPGYETVGAPRSTGSSMFDPVLCELVYRWFCPAGGHVLDPFAGEACKGMVASFLGLNYTGVELREEQVRHNHTVYTDAVERHGGTNEIGDAMGTPQWLRGDSAELARLLPAKARYDLVFTSPPYYDLEQYSSRQEDGSAMPTYEEFMEWYGGVFSQAVDAMAENRFLAVKIGEIRDRKSGAYRNFVGDNISLFLRLGLTYYNEAILVTPAGSLPVRTAALFTKGRKLGKTHQNCLFFYKGSLGQMMDSLGPVSERAVPALEELTPEVEDADAEAALPQ